LQAAAFTPPLAICAPAAPIGSILALPQTNLLRSRRRRDDVCRRRATGRRGAMARADAPNMIARGAALQTPRACCIRARTARLNSIYQRRGERRAGRFEQAAHTTLLPPPPLLNGGTDADSGRVNTTLPTPLHRTPLHTTHATHTFLPALPTPPHLPTPRAHRYTPRAHALPLCITACRRAIVNTSAATAAPYRA